ncbi:DUF4132 domain-containing protein [Actinomadura rugatobispora]|uniref:DUF4132 domain-containing protein n=1 Tax=Actinomadura rugatobispora TaxID=1994 RepID=A0ABW1A557_9ACTN|nr:hypothetical protein GCM10010200_055380 [Actinomadura rugatobispora]
MPDSPEAPVRDAPAESLPALLVDPPWTWAPIVLEGLEPPAVPVTVAWNRYLRERLQEEAAPRGRKDADWEAVAERFRSGRALTELTPKGRAPLYAGLLLHGPHEPAHELLEDRRYWDEFTDLQVLGGVVVRHELKAYPLALHVARREGPGTATPLRPFLSAETAEVMVAQPSNGNADARAWAKDHGAAAAALLVPYALERPGPRRTAAEVLLRLIIADDGAVPQAAGSYGPQAARAMEVLRYPASVPEISGDRDPERLPRILLRGRDTALPADATRSFTRLLLLSRPDRPHSFVEQVIEVCDPGSLAEFAWALYLTAELSRYSWAPDGVQYALRRLGDAETARRLAEAIAAWEYWWAGSLAARNALDVFGAIGGDTALRLLHQIADNPHPSKKVKEEARYALHRAARDRGLTAARLVDRLVPDFGLDAEGGMTLDYGPRGFRVGFDEQLRPYVIDGTGKHRKTLPKPGPKDDAAVADPAHRRFTDLKKGVRSVATEQRKRLHRAMMSGRDWPLEEFHALYVEHPLLRHFARRLVWSAEHDGTATAFRIAEDRSFADVDDKAFTPPPGARIVLPHPAHLGDAVGAWGRVFADYEILQPFPQLGRTVVRLREEERATSLLTRFDGAEVPTAALVRLAQGDWSLRTARDEYHNRSLLVHPIGDRGALVEVRFAPGIPKHAAPAPVQRIEQVEHVKVAENGYVREPIPFGDLNPSTASEILTELADLTTK